MLKVAYPYREEINKLWKEHITKERNKFFVCDVYYEYEIEIKNDSWQELSFVSVDSNDNIIGFLCAKLNRQAGYVNSLSIINFYDINFTFSKDFYAFLHDLLFKYNFRKICFSVVCGNPAEIMYDKYVKKYGGRVVGVFRDDVKLPDNDYYDIKHYEIMKDDTKGVKMK